MAKGSSRGLRTAAVPIGQANQIKVLNNYRAIVRTFNHAAWATIVLRRFPEDRPTAHGEHGRRMFLTSRLFFAETASAELRHTDYPTGRVTVQHPRSGPGPPAVAGQARCAGSKPVPCWVVMAWCFRSEDLPRPPRDLSTPKQPRHVWRGRSVAGQAGEPQCTAARGPIAHTHSRVAARRILRTGGTSQHRCDRVPATFALPEQLAYSSVRLFGTSS